MDAVPYNWTRTRAQESFRGSLPTEGTLTRLAQLVSQADQDSSVPSPLDTSRSAECSFPAVAELCQQEGHPLPKPHQCVSCGRSFSLLSSLQLHICLQDQTAVSHSPPASAALLQSPASAPDSDPGPPDSPSLDSPSLDSPSPDSDAGPPDSTDPDSPDPDSPDPDSPDPDSPDPDSPDPDSPASVQCPHCGRSIRSSAGLSSHLRSNHPSEWILEKRRKSRGGRGGQGGGRGRGAGRGGRLPGVSLDRQKVLSCRSCDMVFVSTAKLYLHRKEKHSREPALRWDARPLASKRRKGETYACSTCGKVFLHHLSLRAHAKQHSSQAHDSPRLVERKPGPLRDPTLGEGRRRGRRPRGRRPGGSGVGRPKSEQGREEEEEGEFPCPSCAEVFSQRASLREHAELHQASVRRRCCCVCSQDMEVCRGPGARRQRLYHCMPCQQPFGSLDAFLLHCQIHLLARVEEEEQHTTPTHTHLYKA